MMSSFCLFWSSKRSLFSAKRPCCSDNSCQCAWRHRRDVDGDAFVTDPPDSSVNPLSEHCTVIACVPSRCVRRPNHCQSTISRASSHKDFAETPQITGWDNFWLGVKNCVALWRNFASNHNDRHSLTVSNNCARDFAYKNWSVVCNNKFLC